MAQTVRITALLVALFLQIACSDPQDTPRSQTQAVVPGKIADPSINEASGLARSHLRDDLLWVINDGGSPPVLHAIGLDGRSQGSVLLSNAKNIDWEDLASFELDGTAWLLIADVGDNENRRDNVTLYLIEEPAIDAVQRQTLPAAQQISIAFPDGPRDAEAVAVDIDNRQILILSKRDIPAVLYAVPLQPPSDTLLTAERLGEIAGIPQPTQHDLDRAIPHKDWHWQPTGMDFAANDDAAVILTYRAVYYFRRQPGQSWFAALQAKPLRFDLGQVRGAEAVTFSHGGDAVFVSIEQRHAPLLRFNLTQ